MGDNGRERIKTARAVRDLVIDASERDLRADLQGAQEDFERLTSIGRSVVERALQKVPGKAAAVCDLHRGLGALVRMLRRRDQLTVEALADTAKIDVAELVAMETDPSVDPKPRTIYQLATFFKLPPQSLVVLSGAVTVGDGVRSEAVRFAASSPTMSKLNREEKKLLNEFVRFLQAQTDR